MRRRLNAPRLLWPSLTRSDPQPPTFGGLCDPRLLIATCVSSSVMDLRCERGRQECCWGGTTVGVGRKGLRCLDGFVTFARPSDPSYKSVKVKDVLGFLVEVEVGQMSFLK